MFIDLFNTFTSIYLIYNEKIRNTCSNKYNKEKSTINKFRYNKQITIKYKCNSKVQLTKKYNKQIWL